MKPEDVPDMYMRKSGVMSYGFCPYRYALDFMLQLPTAATECMMVGTTFHDHVWKLYDLVDKRKILDGVRTISDEYRKYLPDEELYTNFIEMEEERFEYLRGIKRTDVFFPLLTEKKMYSKKLMFRGTVDRVDKEEDGEYVVCDYKTGGKKKWMETHYRFELTGYKLLLDDSDDIDIRSKIDKPIKNICIIFPRIKDTFYTKVKNVTIQAFHRRVAKVRTGVLNGEFEKKDSPLCDKCPRFEACMIGEYDKDVELFREKLLKVVEARENES